jgi:hypothetical protein
MDATDKDLVPEAIAHLRRGDSTAAVTTLERTVDPKRPSQAACRDQYALAAPQEVR